MSAAAVPDLSASSGWSGPPVRMVQISKRFLGTHAVRGVDLDVSGGELSGRACGAAVAWALEVQTPAVSVEKLRGLEAHYGITSHGGAEYFDVHSSLDRVHAAELNDVIAALGSKQHAAAQRTADEITNGLWDLLTAVESVPQ